MELTKIRTVVRDVGVDLKLWLRARNLRARAEEVLALAEVFENADACKKMRGIAVTYGKLAKRLERLAEVEKV